MRTRQLSSTRLRPRAFAIAYRMLGSVAEAEDVVQEAMLRLHRELEGGRADDRVAARVRCRRSSRGWRSTSCARHARGASSTSASGCQSRSSARRQADDPATEAETADSLSMAFLVLLESLTPEQRAALLLHDVFDYRYDEIAEIVGTSEANARQLATRARAARSTSAGRASRPRRTARAAGRRVLRRVRRGRRRRARGAAGRGRRAAGRRRRQGPGAGAVAHGRARVARTIARLDAPGRREVGRARRSAWPRSTASPARCCSPRTGA